MRPSALRFARILRRSQLRGTPAARRIIPEPVQPHVRTPVLIDVLRQQQIQAGANYPANVRIEPVVTKKTFRGLPAETREALKKIIKER